MLKKITFQLTRAQSFPICVFAVSRGKKKSPMTALTSNAENEPHHSGKREQSFFYFQ